MPLTAVSGGVCVWAAVVAVVDVVRHRIPNALLLLLLVPAVLALAVNGQGLLGVPPLNSLAGLLAAGLPLIPGYALGHMGAGDVKLSASLGLLMGPLDALRFLAASLILLGLASALALLWRRSQGGTLQRIPAAPAFALAFAVHVLVTG